MSGRNIKMVQGERSSFVEYVCSKQGFEFLSVRGSNLQTIVTHVSLLKLSAKRS
jgi:hypothetical protein